MTTRTWPILATGFGSLLVLIGLFAWGAAQRADQIQAEVASMHEGFQASEQVLNQVQSDLYFSGTLVRDFLVDPSPQTTESYRQELLEIRSSIAKRLDQLQPPSSPEEAGRLKHLRLEIDTYWEVLEPIFEWTASQKLARSSPFLRQEVSPRRKAVLSIAREIRELNESNFEKEQEKTRQNRQEFRSYMAKMSAGALSLALLVALASIFRISRLERRAEQQREQTERHKRELRLLSQQLVRAQEDERKSISRELHDEVGQMLTAMRMELGNLEQLRNSNGDQFGAHLEDARRLTGQALQLVRDLAMGLRPSMLDDLGLAPALEWQAREFSRRSGLPVTAQIDGLLDQLPDTHRTCVYRVVQEALTNCARHSKAKTIRITLHGDKHWVSLVVQDDGVGFAPDKSSAKGLGLIGIEERVQELGGKVAIFSQPQRGTLLQVEIPLVQVSL
jgi:signal transduction histidine kinase